MDKVRFGTVYKKNWYGSSAHRRGRTFLSGSEHSDRTTARRHVPAATTPLTLGLCGGPVLPGHRELLPRPSPAQDRVESEVSRGPDAYLRQQKVDTNGEGLWA